jgi:phosphoenolpyruvate carboxykinase (ATP)
MATQVHASDIRRHDPTQGLTRQGIEPRGTVHWNVQTPELVEGAIRRGEGHLADMGPFVAVTAPHTGRSPKDKFIVRAEPSAADVDWGPVNQPMTSAHFDALAADVRAYLDSAPDLFVQDLHAGADPAHRLSVRYVTPNAWHALFVRNMFIRPALADLATFRETFTVLHAPEMHADPARHGTRSGTFVVLSFEHRTVLIGGTRYAGELKKAMFTVMNYFLPKTGVLSMHCSANVGSANDTALFFGLSGTGKTTLSADPERALIGDDEHGWSDDGIFNIEGGCYAKVINLSPDGEPDIYQTTQMFGTVLENVVLDTLTGAVRFADQSITENTRASYPLSYIRRHVPSGRGGHPVNIVFLTADAFGVLPPIARLTPEQAMYYFLSGYTAKVAGTERGVTEPQATFSSCFGAVFLVWPPAMYAKLLGERLRRHRSRVWLVNTGWTGGPYGIGHRISLADTRALVRAALSGVLDRAAMDVEPVFGLATPTAVPGVAPGVLRPREQWPDPEEYDRQAAKLAQMFHANFQRFAESAGPDIAAAGPRIR